MKWLLPALLLVTVELVAEELRFPVDALTRELKGGATQSFTFAANGGDLVLGPIRLKGVDVNAVVYDARGTKIRTTHLFQPGTERGGILVAPATGTYRLDLIPANSAQSGEFTMSLDRIPVSVRMAGVHAEARSEYASPRISRLRAEVEAGKPGAVEEFWLEARRGGGPIIEAVDGNAADVLVTFVWREIYETHNVLLFWHSPRWEDYYMARIPGTDIWYKTLRIQAGSRFSYAISPNDRLSERVLLPEADFEYFTAQYDPLNPPSRYLQLWDFSDVSEARTSVLELPNAPEERWYRETPTASGRLETVSVDLPSLNGITSTDPLPLRPKMNIRVYTPPGYESAAGPYPLIVFFAPHPLVFRTLDNLIAAGRIRPAVAVALPSNGLGRAFNPSYEKGAGALAKDLVPWVRSRYSISMDPKDIVLSGWSGGGLAASYVALKHPQVFGNVLTQSAAFRQSAPGNREPNSIVQMYLNSPALPVRFYIDAGTYDNVPDLPMYQLALDEGNTQGNRHVRDVLKAKGYDVVYKETGGGHEPLHWMATLPEGLMVLLPPKQAK